MPSTNRYPVDGQSQRPLHGLRAVASPTDALVACVLILGWAALLAWTGSGPRGWQARLCADLDAQPRACAAVQAQHSGGPTLASGAAS